MGGKVSDVAMWTLVRDLKRGTEPLPDWIVRIMLPNHYRAGIPALFTTKKDAAAAKREMKARGYVAMHRMLRVARCRVTVDVTPKESGVSK